MKYPKITDPIKAKALFADAIAMGFKFSDLPQDMHDSDFLEIANFLVRWFLDECAKKKVRYLFK